MLEKVKYWYEVGGDTGEGENKTEKLVKELDRFRFLGKPVIEETEPGPETRDCKEEEKVAVVMKVMKEITGGV